MKTKLILEANEPEEIEELKTAMNATRWKLVVEETLNHIRTKLKHGNLTEEADKELEELRQHIWDEISGYGLSLYW
jgi:hypothetical protein